MSISAETTISADIEYVDIEELDGPFTYSGIEGEGDSFTEAFKNGNTRYSNNERLIDDITERHYDHLMQTTCGYDLVNYVQFHLEEHWESTRPMPDPDTYVPSLYMIKKFRESESFKTWCWEEANFYVEIWFEDAMDDEDSLVRFLGVGDEPVIEGFVIDGEDPFKLPIETVTDPDTGETTNQVVRKWWRGKVCGGAISEIDETGAHCPSCGYRGHEYEDSTVLVYSLEDTDSPVLSEFPMLDFDAQVLIRAQLDAGEMRFFYVVKQYDESGSSEGEVWFPETLMGTENTSIEASHSKVLVDALAYAAVMTSESLLSADLNDIEKNALGLEYQDEDDILAGILHEWMELESLKDNVFFSLILERANEIRDQLRFMPPRRQQILPLAA